jgi:ABC-2 type transport system permease protein
MKRVSEKSSRFEQVKFHRSLFHHCIISLHYIAQMVKTRLHYRGDFILETVASLLSQATGLAVVGIIFENVPILRSWSRAEVFFIYGFALMSQSIFGAVAQGFYWFADKYVIRGEFDRVLLRPLNPLFQVLLENFNLEWIPDLILGAVILALAGSTLGLHFGPVEFLILGVMLLGAALVLAGLFLALASVSFWAEDRVGILPPVYNLMAFGRYPLTIYQRAIQVLLSWVLPFGFVAFYPSTGFLGRDEFSAFFWGTPLAGLVVFSLGYLVWRIGVRHYTSTGS